MFGLCGLLLARVWAESQANSKISGSWDLDISLKSNKEDNMDNLLKTLSPKGKEREVVELNKEDNMVNLLKTVSPKGKEREGVELLRSIRGMINPDGKLKPKQIVVVIMTAVANFDRREAIRKSWMAQAELNAARVVAKFVLSGVILEADRKRLHHEMNAHDDCVVLVDLQQESYRSIDLKMFAAMQWAWSTYGCEGGFVFKTDDDVVLDTLHVRRMTEYFQAFGKKSIYGGFHGKLWSEQYHNPKHKHSMLTESEWALAENATFAPGEGCE